MPYTREEMEAILQRAIERQHARHEGVDHEELVAAASEIGVSREDVEAAAREIADKKAEPSKESTASIERRRLILNVGTWAIFSVFFYLLCALTGGSWWVWPVLAWGLAVAMRVLRYRIGDRPRNSRESRREARRLRRQQRRREKLADFERKVTIGTDAVMRVLEQTRSLRAAAMRVAHDEPRARVAPVEESEVDSVEADPAHTRRMNR